MVYTAAAMIARTHDGSETPARSRAAHCGAAIGRGQASRKRNRSVRRTCFSAVSATGLASDPYFARRDATLRRRAGGRRAAAIGPRDPFRQRVALRAPVAVAELDQLARERLLEQQVA